MGLIKIQTDDPESLSKGPEFPLITPGKHLFVVANRPAVEATNDPEKTNQVIKVELRCQDEDENKGRAIFDNFLIVTDTSTEKQQTTKRIHDAKLAQFVASTGLKTMDQIKAGEEFDVAETEGKSLNAVTGNPLEEVYPKELDEHGKAIKKPRSRVKQYLFEAQGNPEVSGS